MRIGGASAMGRAVLPDPPLGHPRTDPTGAGENLRSLGGRDVCPLDGHADIYVIRTSDTCRARHYSTGQRKRQSVPVRSRCEAQADEARPFDNDPLVDGAKLHPRIVDRVGGTVCSPAVLRLGRQTLMDRVARLTLVTLDSTAFNIPMSVGEVAALICYHRFCACRTGHRRISRYPPVRPAASMANWATRTAWPGSQ